MKLAQVNGINVCELVFVAGRFLALAFNFGLIIMKVTAVGISHKVT